MADIINFPDKEELDPNTGVDDKYLIRASDINDIKKGINDINKNVESLLNAVACVISGTTGYTTIGSYTEWKAKGGSKS